ncbi:TetR/AcrR family transcriptional regulator [Kineococcus sp. TBRC 1896]|uniref:TetR/AcrR family transcriptional regulator n=1 Tax=Kineococcus mangrovi TaxID=1660183 RepID=A0ABV4HZF7_9ACTN
MPLPPDGRRAEVARANRSAVVHAARRLFAAQGYFQTTVEQIARAAGVAPATVYATTGGKQGLLLELVEAWATTPAVRESLEGVARCRRVEDAVSELASGVRRVRDEWGDVIEVVLATAPHEPSVAALLVDVRHRYEADVGACVTRIVDLTARPQAHRQVMDVLWFYFGFHGYALLVDDRGWDSGQAELWLVRQASRAVEDALADPAPDPGRATPPAGAAPARLRQWPT